MRVTVIKNKWNDTDTIKLLGQVGRVTLYNKEIPFVDVLFNHIEEPVTMHIEELEVKQKTN